MLLKNVRVVRDRLTGASSGFAFVELHSLKESQDLLQYLENLPTPLEVDGKALIVNYAKNTFTTAYVLNGITVKIQPCCRCWSGKVFVAYTGCLLQSLLVI